MDNFIDNNIKKEQICRTCLTDDGNFFNITDTFDHSTLTQMIQNITSLEMNPLDGYTQSICFECVKDVRKAHKFRIKCLESNDALMKGEVKLNKSLKVPIFKHCKIEAPEFQEVKQELDDSCDVSDYFLDTEQDYEPEPTNFESCDNNDDVFTECKEKDEEHSENKRKKSPTIIFNCPLCHGLFHNDTIYKKHIKKIHPDRLEDECFKKEYEPLGFLLKTKHLDSVKILYKCALDEFAGNSFVEFKSHMKEHTGDKPVICVDCGFRTSDIYLLEKHRIQKHLDEKKFACTICTYSCQTNSALKTHYASHSSEKNHKCKLCPAAFKTASGLSVHKSRIHENRKPHVCMVCEKAFFCAIRLRNHMRIHTGERPHICHYCGKEFSRVENMRTHVTLMHEPIKTLFKCDKCDYSSKTKAQLKMHTQRHNGEKYFQCTQCPYSALLSYDLKLHMLRHSGQKNFACDLCDYKGVTADCVKKHRKVHTGEKPFACTICDYSGRTRRAIKRHMQTHSTEPIFQCPNCPYKTNVEEILKKHLRRNCVIKKRGRRPSKLSNIPDNILINDEIKEDVEEPISLLTSNV